MEATQWNISTRKRSDVFGITNPADFELEKPSGIDPHMVLTDPCLSLYCLDHAKRCALFVETAPEVDLCAAPFMYLSQYQHALSVVTIPYETLYELADSLTLDSRRLILVYSVGRSGSTLVGSALGAVPGIVGLSEPDTFTQLIGVRGWDGNNELDTGNLLEACIKLQCKPTVNIPNPAAWAIKFRSYCIELADLLHARFPAAKNLFLYRNALSQVISMGRAFVPPGVDDQDTGFRAFLQNFFITNNRTIAEHVKSGGPLLSLIEIGTMQWLRVMECYIELVSKQGVDGLAVRFEDLKAVPRAAAQAIVTYCGFPNSPMEAVYQVLEKDSQAGTVLSQEALKKINRQPTPAEETEFDQLFAAHPTIKSPDFIVPGTWQRP